MIFSNNSIFFKFYGKFSFNTFVIFSSQLEDRLQRGIAEEMS